MTRGGQFQREAIGLSAISPGRSLQFVKLLNYNAYVA